MGTGIVQLLQQRECSDADISSPVDVLFRIHGNSLLIIY